jgi:hypothetical protein
MSVADRIAGGAIGGHEVSRRAEGRFEMKFRVWNQEAEVVWWEKFWRKMKAKRVRCGGLDILGPVSPSS